MMTWLLACAWAVPISWLLLPAVVPGALIRGDSSLWRRLASAGVWSALCGSIAVAVGLAISGSQAVVWGSGEGLLAVRFGFQVDGLGVAMALLISFIGVVIARYSHSYLRGEPRQGKFFRWMSVTLGATLLMVTCSNLIALTAAWMLTSLGLHQLLTLYSERSWAVWAARKKFLISRLGDVLLIAALILTFRSFGTTEYSELFSMAQAIHHGGAPGVDHTGWIAILLVLGAMTKSAQFPFHSWLPDTMETPTPVSALMHAGVINAGGFLVIRLSPLITLSPVSLNLLALVGASTALLGSVVMLTQTSIKRSLAYSTIAQMGFMMLQCGLGAFTAAFLHIVAHSAYKAHAFLTSGSVLDRAARTAVPPAATAASGYRFAGLLLALVVAGGVVFGLLPTVGVNLLAKPGGSVFALIMALAVTQVMWLGFRTGRGTLALRSVGAALLVIVSYVLAYQVADLVLADSIANQSLPPSIISASVTAVVVLGFASLFILQSLPGGLDRRPWVQALYVHALNGFYVDIPARRLTAMFYRQSAPVP
ncbi:MAG: hypothetical protein JSS02_25530 [Planctomycetes bacterium]|nr:hypothetical protein [Planctomycetota bacterium]